MSKPKYKSLILLLFAFAIICTFLLAANSFNQGLASSTNYKSALRPSSDYLDDYYANCTGIISPIGIGEWEIFTAFQNYSVNEEEDFIYFGRDLDDSRESANATLTTPYLTLNESHSLYTLSFDYFSPRTIELANNIKVYASNDGTRYEKIGEIEKAYNSNEDNYISASFDVESDVKYLRCELKIYNSTVEDSRIYLKNFDLAPKNPSGKLTPSFTVQIDKSPLKYTGYKQLPLYTIECQNPTYQYITREFVLDASNKIADSIDIGIYKLIVLIYNYDNAIVHIAEASFTIDIGSSEIITYTYNGASKELAIQDFEEVRYYKDYVPLESAPKNAGRYTAKVYDQVGMEIKTVFMIIKPMEIINISSNKSFTKLYDGTTNVYDAQKQDFVFSNEAGVVVDASLTIDNVRFASNIGKSYLIFDKQGLGNNFVVTNVKVTTTIEPEIKKMDIKIARNTDQNDNTVIAILDKSYDGQDTASIDINSIISRYKAVKNAPIEFLGVPKDDSFYIDGLKATFESVYAGNDSPVNLQIIDKTYLDRFNASIYSKGLIVGNIVPKKVSILPSSDIKVVTKTYDATLKAEVSINTVEFGADIILADKGIMADNNNFELTYTAAEYANANVGIKQVSVKDLVLHSKNPIYTKVINSYEVYDTSIDGEITKMPLAVVDEYFNIIAGQNLPIIQTSPTNINLYVSYHYNKEDAENGVLQIGDFNTTDYLGDFYIRVEVPASETNYEILNNYKVIPIEVTEGKKEQEITFNLDAFKHNNLEYGDYYKMAIGGTFTPKAVSVATHQGISYLTGLPITYDRNTGTKMTFSQGVYTAREEGLVTITASQMGSLSYNAAIQVTIKILIVDYLITANNDIGIVDETTLYYGDKTPDIYGSALFADEKVLGDFVNKGYNLSIGSANYFYDFIPSEKYLGEYKDIKIIHNASKATLLVNISDITMDYYSDIDFINFAQITLKKGGIVKKLTISEFPKLDFVFSGDVKSLVHKETAYKVGFNDSFAYYLQALENSNYNIVFENESFNIFVNLREISIEIVDISKEYGFSDYQVLFTIDGCDNEDLDLIREKTKVIEQVKFDSDIGRYVLLISVEEDASLINKYYIKKVNGFMNITKANVEFRANDLTSIYLQQVAPTSFTVSGFHIESDQDYYSRYIQLSHVVTNTSNTGTYPISINGIKQSYNYNFSFENGTYTVNPATLTGITLSDGNFIYDGKKHSIGIVYDKDIWDELNVIYNNYDIVTIGRYPITAIVSKENYQNLVLSANLTISSISVSTSNKQTVAAITMLGTNIAGFDPQATLMLVQSTNKEVLDGYSQLLNSTEDTTENIMGVYNFFLTIDGSKIEIEGNNEVKIKLEGVGSTSKVRVLANVGGVLIEVDHNYQSGYIVFESLGATEFAIVKQVSAYSKDTSSLIIGIGVGVILLIVFYLAFLGYKGKSKSARKRSIRKHKRWA